MNVWTAVEENEDARKEDEVEKEEEDRQQPPDSQMNPNKPAAPAVLHETTLPKPPPPFTSTITPWKTYPRTPTGKRPPPQKCDYSKTINPNALTMCTAKL